MDLRRRIYYGLLIIGLSFGAGWLSKPQQTKTEVKTVEVIREVVKNIKGLKETIVVEKRLDGTTVTRTDRSMDSITESDKSKSKSKTVTQTGKAQWGISLHSTVLETIPKYSVGVDRRIIGNLSLGLQVQSDLHSKPMFLVGARIEF